MYLLQNIVLVIKKTHSVYYHDISYTMIKKGNGTNRDIIHCGRLNITSVTLPLFHSDDMIFCNQVAFALSQHRDRAKVTNVSSERVKDCPINLGPLALAVLLV